MTRYKLHIQAAIRPDPYDGTGLRIDEEIELPAGSFLELAQILGRFHDLAEQLARRDQPPGGGPRCTNCGAETEPTPSNPATWWHKDTQAIICNWSGTGSVTPQLQAAPAAGGAVSGGTGR